jgi:hypothetical protein
MTTTQHIENYAYEQETPNDLAWGAWLNKAADLCGLRSLDGDEREDGYSLDYAQELYQAGYTPEEYAKMKKPLVKLCRFTRIEGKSIKTYDDDGYGYFQYVTIIRTDLDDKGLRKWADHYYGPLVDPDFPEYDCSGISWETGRDFKKLDDNLYALVSYWSTDC